MENRIKPPPDFIRQIISSDIKHHLFDGKIHTRFPPEPNGFLHIGHAKAICLNFGLAKEYKAACNLRFDDTNPTKEKTQYIDAIIKDVRWLGFEWDKLCYASDYFDQLYTYACELVKLGKAYVCSLDAEKTREYRGTLTEAGKNSPHRERDVETNLRLFEEMRQGKFKEGEHTLRAKIDMASPNLNMRDPVIYRIMHQTHYRKKDNWCIYPTYDFTHCLSDSIEKITHSLCTLEFEDHRPLYDWFLDTLNLYHPKQIEFARLQLKYTVTSKRKLKQLVEQNIVSGWDDPRMPTISGMRKRGIPPAAIHDFCNRIGITKNDSWIEMDLLESCVRDYLNTTAPRIMAVINPLKVTIENYPEDETKRFEVPNHPKNPDLGTRKLPFSNTIYIEHDDFMENPEKKFFRLAPGKTVKLRYAYCITCTDVIKDDAGNIIELRCQYVPDSDEYEYAKKQKIKGIIHWVSGQHAKKITTCLYDRLFLVEDPTAEEDMLSAVNPDSLTTHKNCLIEASVKIKPAADNVYQFERLGYFSGDNNADAEQPVFNRVVTIKDNWQKKTK